MNLTQTTVRTLVYITMFQVMSKKYSFPITDMNKKVIHFMIMESRLKYFLIALLKLMSCFKMLGFNLIFAWSSWFYLERLYIDGPRRKILC